MNDVIAGTHLKELLSYDPRTGIFRWRVAFCKKVRVGGEAGSVHSYPATDYRYRVITIHGNRYRASRLAWYYMIGEWPTNEIDHANTNPLDNRWANLREATHSQNATNTRGKSRSGLPKGVTRNHKRYQAKLTVDHDIRYLGTFDTPEEAHAAYAMATDEAFGAYARRA